MGDGKAGMKAATFALDILLGSYSWQIAGASKYIKMATRTRVAFTMFVMLWSFFCHDLGSG
jgi:hypothetical protein